MASTAPGSAGAPARHPSLLVGREDLRATLVAEVATAADGRGGLALLTGEAGIGKTRLLGEAEREATNRGMRVVRAAGWDDPGVPSFWVWTQVVRGLADGRDADTLRSVWGSHANRVLSLLPERSDGSDQKETDDGAGATRFPLFDAVASVVALTAREQPLLLVLDDLHWADQGSLRLLRFLATTTEGAPVLVLGAYREHDADAKELDGLLTRATVLPVPPLTVDEVHQILETQHRLHATPADAQRVTDRTGGNPLFVGEIGRLAAARGLDVVGDALPASAVATIARRVARLSQPAAEVLGTAAIAGPVVDVRLLTRVLPLTASDVSVLLDEAVQVGLVVVTGDRRLGFSHALVRDALEAGLPDATRRKLHLDIARALLAGGGAVPDAEVAHHFSAAGPLAPPGAAARHWVAAAEAAAHVQAYEVAAGAFASALARMPADDAERPVLLRRCGDCLLLSGDLAAARVAFAEACDLARAAGRPEDFAGAALGFAAGLTGFEVRLFDHAQIDLLEEALRLLPEGDGEQRAYLLARLSVALSFLGSAERRVALAAESVAMARRLGSQPAVAHGLAAHCDAIAGPVYAEQREVESGEIVQIASELGDPALELLGLRLRVVALAEQGRLERVADDVRAFALVAARLRQPFYGWYVPLWRGFAAHLVGDLEELRRRAEEVVGLAATADSQNAQILGEVLRIWYYLESGSRPDGMEGYLDQLAEIPELHPAGDSMLAIFPGQPDDLRRRAAAQIGRLVGDLLVDAEWVSNVCFAAWSIIELWEPGEPSRVLYDLLRPHAHRFAVDGIAAGFHGSVERYLGSLAWLAGGSRALSADGHFERALAANERAGALLAAAHTRRAHASVLLDRSEPGDAERARTLLAEAGAAYDRMGLRHRVEEVHRLGASGSAPDQRVDDAPEETVFRRSGEVWEVAFRGRRSTVRDSKGMRDLAVLLARPGTEVHALDLVSDARSVRHEGDLGEALDETARAAYRRRIGELDQAIADAEDLGHADAADRARAEREAIVAELTRAYGLGGRPRRVGDPAERARTSVTWRIRDAIGRVERVHPELGAHLRNAVRTGTYCRYDPEVPPGWVM